MVERERLRSVPMMPALTGQTEPDGPMGTWLPAGQPAAAMKPPVAELARRLLHIPQRKLPSGLKVCQRAGGARIVGHH